MMAAASVDARFWWVLLTAGIVRGLALWFDGGTLAGDIDSYARLAVNWSESGVYGFEASAGQVRPTAFRPPLYPWLLSWIVRDSEVSRLGVAMLHWLMGVGGVALTYAVARRLNLRVAWLAALAVAFDPLLVHASQLVMTETLATLLAMAVWLAWLVALPSAANGTRSPQVVEGGLRWVGAPLVTGLLLGLSILARPTAAPWAALLTVGLCCWPPASRRRLAQACLMTVGVCVCVAPWMARNAAYLGKPIWATTHGGYTLLLANNPPLYQHFRASGPSRQWDAEPFHRAWAGRYRAGADPRELDFWQSPPAVAPPVSVSDEIADDRLAYAAARESIVREPITFAQSIAYRVSWLWALWPSGQGRGTTWLIGVWYGGWFALGLLALIAAFWRGGIAGWIAPWMPWLLLVVTLSLVHAVYWSNMRMRSPAMPGVYLLAAGVLGGRREPLPDSVKSDR